MPTRYQGTPRERNALDAFIKLMRASNFVHAEATRHLSEHGLSPSQFAVLEALYHIGPMCLTELAQRILRTSGNLTMVVDNLEKRGLAERVQQSRDRRFVSVQITAKGSDLIRSIFPAHAARITEVMGQLSPEEQRILGDLCRKLGQAEEH
jgi:MarR family 2-MHQ and catechol resistance regulon transcriptional repressor